MIERHIRSLQALALLSLFILSSSAQALDDYWPPWVTLTTTDSATINWRGEENGSGLVDYAASDYYELHHEYEKTVATAENATYQHVRLSGLEPNTSYTYRVRPSGAAGSSEGSFDGYSDGSFDGLSDSSFEGPSDVSSDESSDSSFDNRSFRTMPQSGPFNFIVISDPQKGRNYEEKQRFKYVADAIEREPDVLFVMVGGDYNGHDSDGLWSQFFEVADGMLSRSAIFPTIGNHEYHNSSGGDNPPTGAVHFHQAFDMPLNYSFDCSGVRFIVLNSPDPKNANGDDPHTSLSLAESQESWLREQLEDDALLGAFTIHHHPIWDCYNSSSNPNLEPWERLYHSYNISAAFAGHTHNYQRYSIRGIPYFVLGNAGGRCNDLNGDRAPDGFQFGMNKTLGYLKVSVDPENNSATAQEWIVATVKEDDSKDRPDVLKAPKLMDSVTFPLRH